MSLLEKRHFMNTSLEVNSNKFWIIERFSDNNVVTTYGRVGDSGQKTTKNFPSEQEAKKFFDSKIKEKSKVKEGRRDAYTEINILDDSVTTTGINRDIIEIAAQEIETTSEQVRELIRFFGRVNIHNITSQTTIRYNIADGCFRTPLGVVDKKCIDEAKELLDKISKFENKKESDCIKLANTYLRRIPSDIGGSHIKIHIEDVFGTDDLIQKQADILEGLEAAVSQSRPITGDTERVFNTKLDICKDEKVIECIRTKFSRYSPYNKICNTYEINIKDVNDRFIAIGKPIGNIEQLWHGTSPANLLSILKVGLIIPKKYSNGWRFGAGVYFSDKSSMSLNYTPANSRNNKSYKYMFLSDVAIGNIYYGSGKNLSQGYNSRWAEKESSTSQIIIYNTSQLNLLYLLEIEG